MNIEHEFAIDAPLERVWNAMIDPQQVVTCLPGASLDSVDGESFGGHIAVKLGPMSLTYKGEGKLSQEPDRRRILISGRGVEQRGAGTAAASIVLDLQPAGEGRTLASLSMDLDLAGKPAQFGRGILAEVVARLAGTFADRLGQRLSAPEGEVAPTLGAGTPAEDALDLLDLGRAVLLKRLVPVVAVVAAGAAVALVLRRLSRRPGHD